MNTTENLQVEPDIFMRNMNFVNFRYVKKQIKTKTINPAPLIMLELQINV